MNIPVWFKPALIGAGAGAVVLAIVGFTAGGWMTSKKAAALASAQSQSETVAALVPYCMAAAEADPQSQSVLEKLKDASRYSRGAVIIDAGWATAPGAPRANNGLASACADQLVAAM